MFSITIRERSGQVYTFHFDKPEVLVGRVKGNDVILPKQNISKRHAMIRVQGERFVVEDLGSTNGTYVNGHRIASAVEIGPEDKVYLGDFVMNFLDLQQQPQAVSDSGVMPELPELPEEAVSPAGRRRDANIGATMYSQPDFDAMDAAESIVAPVLFPDQLDLSELEALMATAEADYSGLGAVESAEPPKAPDVPEVPLHVPTLRNPVPPPVAPIVPDESTRSYGSGVPADERMTGAIDGLAHAMETRAALDQQPQARVRPPIESVPKASSAAAPADLSARTPTTHERAGLTDGGPDAPHYDALAGLYRNALRDLRPGVPTDASQMSDSDWAEMEDRVVAFVDGATDLPADADVARLKRDLIYELAGLGPLEPMLDDPSVEIVEVNGPSQICVFRRGSRESVADRFSCQQALASAVDRLVRATGNSQDRSKGHAEGTLIDGTTVRVVWPPLCPTGPVVLLRKQRVEAPDLKALIERGAVSPDAASVLRELVGQRRSIAVCGVPNVGRRTVLNALAMLIPEQQRIVVIEDGVRLRLPQDHTIRLDSAARNESALSLLDVARRMGPDWLLLGECATLGVNDLIDASTDYVAPWIGSFFARSSSDLLQRALHAYVLRHPGVPESIAKKRVFDAFDVVAEFSSDGGKAVLKYVFAVSADVANDAILTPLSGGRHHNPISL